jgi:DNA-binding transcriptional MerR regulator
MNLLAPSDHTAGGFRVYGADAIERVRWIGKLQDLGFTLTQIQSLVDANTPDALPKEAMARVRDAFTDKQRELTAQIERLQQLKRELASSLDYLETCATACTQHDSKGTSCCGTCSTHGAEKAPSLVEGARS